MKKHPKVLRKIDWDLLREQKKILIDVMYGNAQITDQRNTLEGITNLIDNLQIYAHDKMGIDKDIVFGTIVSPTEPEQLPQPTTDAGIIPWQEPTRKVFLCPHCGSDNVEIKAWVEINKTEPIIINPVGGELSDFCDDEIDCYCNDCEQHGTDNFTNIPESSKLIGFQVVNDNFDIHPKMAGSFCVFSLKQANKMINDSNVWKLSSVWSDEIEEPTMMFEGDPRA